MDKNTEARLTLEGWTVVCEHPFELQHEDGSFASGRAADLVVEQISAFRSFSRLSAFQQLKRLQTEAQEINDLVQHWVLRCIQGTRATNPEDDSLWKAAYELIFTDSINGRVHSISKAMSLEFEWVDPDMGYNDDVLAYAQGLQAFVDKASIFLDENQDATC